MRVLGIDPGLRITGYGCVEGSSSRPALVEAGAIRLAKSGETPAVAPRLVELERDVRDLVEALKPDVVAVEAIFTHGSFPATAVKMAHARGVILLCAHRAGVDLVELAPKSVKQAITGSGRADKAQMQRSVQTLFGLAEPPEPADVADAIGIATAGLVRAGGAFV